MSKALIKPYVYITKQILFQAQVFIVNIHSSQVNKQNSKYTSQKPHNIYKFTSYHLNHYELHSQSFQTKYIKTNTVIHTPIFCRKWQ